MLIVFETFGSLYAGNVDQRCRHVRLFGDLAVCGSLNYSEIRLTRR